jgi:hypothetical protein
MSDGPCQAVSADLVTFRVQRGDLAALRCRFPTCSGAPIGIFHAPKGCFCWDDPLQALCAQHATSAHGPLSDGWRVPITCLLDFRVEDEGSQP